MARCIRVSARALGRLPVAVALALGWQAMLSPVQAEQVGPGGGASVVAVADGLPSGAVLRVDRGPPEVFAGTVRGRVIDAGTRQPRSGASVEVLGTRRGNITDASGMYVVSGFAAGTVRVRASMLGYTSQEQSVVVPDGQIATADFALSTQAVALEGLVVIGYGTARKKDLTGSVASVTTTEVTARPTANVTEALQGKVPGLDIVRMGGSPNSDVKINLRGARSLVASNDPLVIVDGNQFGNLSDLNPNDIENIQVLKDASSTAIYGSRGANGVILVTTKNGTARLPSVTLNSNVGMTEVTSYPRINTGPEFIAQKRDANHTTGLWNSVADDAKIFTPVELANVQNGIWTDFRSLLFHQGQTQNHQLAINTATENTRAYLSAAVYDEQGILKLDNLRRYSVRLNLERELSKAWRVGTNTQYSYSATNQRQNPLNLANKISPLTPAFDSTGAIILWPNQGKDVSPLADEVPNAFQDNTLTSRVLPSLYAEWKPIENFSLRSTFGADVRTAREGTYAASATIQQNSSPPQATYTSYSYRNLSWENVATLKHSIGSHAFQLTGITSLLKYQRDSVWASGRNQLLPSQLYYGLGNAPDNVAIASGYLESTLMSLAGRANYSFREKYLLTFTGRLDGSSSLGPDNQWAFFPSVAGAWRISDEKFMKDNSLVNELKLRLSYGVSGNSSVAPYSTQSSLTKIPFSYGETSAPGYTFSFLVGNKNLKWEMSANADVGLDFGLWGNRVAGSIDAYVTHTSDLLMKRFLPATTGDSAVMQNVGKTMNRGLELTLNTVNIDRPKLSWRSTLTFFTNHEEITALAAGQNDIANGWFIGSPTNVFYDYKKIGIWQTADSALAASFGQKPGSIRVADLNGDGKITAANDRMVLGSPRPSWSGSMINTVRYHAFDLSLTAFVRWGQMMNYEYYQTYKPDGVENGAHVNYWLPNNPSNDFPLPDTRLNFRNYPYFTTLYYTNGSFVKLSEGTLGFTLPNSVAGALHATRPRLYLTGRNLAWWAKVPNYDAERGGSLSSPMTRVVVLGVDLSF